MEKNNGKQSDLPWRERQRAMAQAVLLHQSGLLSAVGRGCIDCRTHSFAVAAALLVVYPAWDAIANVIDAASSGGLAANRSQAINVAASSVMTLAVILALTMNMNWVLGAFGLWAIFSGLLQLGAAVRRWKTSGGQWAMILSGGQSAVAGAQAQMPQEPSISTVAGYAGVGAFYFLVSAISLTMALSRRSTYPVS